MPHEYQQAPAAHEIRRRPDAEAACFVSSVAATGEC